VVSCVIDSLYQESTYSEASAKPGNWWKAGDIWSLGCVFAEMLKGTPLFDSKDKSALLSQVQSVWFQLLTNGRYAL
jgi:hypothetical protein